MKKTFSCLALLLATNFLFAQTKIKEGVVTYKVQWTLPENMEALADNLPTEIKVYFKGDSSSAASLKTRMLAIRLMDTTIINQVLESEELRKKALKALYDISLRKSLLTNPAGYFRKTMGV